MVLVRSTWAEEPRLLLDTHGPVGRLHTLRFVPGTHRLIGAGADKLVYEWILHTPTEHGPHRLVRSHVLRWPIARGPNGVIYALDVSRDGEWVAVGGQSAYGKGHIWLYHRPERKLERVLKGHDHKVMRLKFSDDGARLASVDQNGEVCIWSIPAGEQLAEKQTFVADDVQPFSFLQDGSFLRPVQEERSAIGQSLVNDDTGARRSREVLPVVRGQVVTALHCAHDSAAWACALRDGTIIMGEGVRQQTRFRSGQTRIFSLQLGPKSVLLAATAQDAEGQSWLELWSVERGQERLIDRVGLGTSDDAYACALSDDGALAAVYANGPRELWVFELLDNAGQLRATPLSEQGALRLFSGHDIDAIRFIERDGSRLAIEVAGSDPGGWEFNAEFGGIKRTQPDSAADPGVANPNLPANGTPPGSKWSIEIAESDQIVVNHLGHPDAPITLRLNEDAQGRALCVEQLPQTSERELWFTVGTDRDGIYVYHITAGQGPVRLVRSFRDHTGRVTHLDASEDGTVLSSLAEDRLIKLWSLKGLTEAPRESPHIATWGAEFVVQNGVIVGKVLPGGIAERRGLATGDRIRRVRWGRGSDEAAESAAGILRAFNERPVWTPIVIYRDRLANRITNDWEPSEGAAESNWERREIVPAWEPMVTMFLDRSGEWAVWMPDGTYNASATGDVLFGWQVNRGSQEEPGFFSAGRFRERFEQRDAIQRLFSQNVQQPSPQHLVAKSLWSEVLSRTEVRLIEPQTGDVQRDRSDLHVRARITRSEGPSDRRSTAGAVCQLRACERTAPEGRR